MGVIEFEERGRVHWRSWENLRIPSKTKRWRRSVGTACRIYYPWLYSKGIVRLQRGGWMSRKTAWNASFQRQQILMSHLWQGSRRELEVNHWDQLTGMSGLGWWPNGLVFAMVLGKIMKPWLNPGSICGSIKMPYFFFAGQKLYWFVVNTSGFSFTSEFFDWY